MQEEVGCHVRILRGEVAERALLPWAQHVDHRRAQLGQGKAEPDGHQDTDEQDIQCRKGFGRNDPVVNLHGKQHACQGERIRDQRCNHDTGVHPAILQQDLAQPVVPVRLDIGIDPGVGNDAGRAGDDEDRACFDQIAQRHPLLQPVFTDNGEIGGSIVADPRDHGQIAIAEPGDQRQPPTAERQRCGFDQADLQPAMPGECAQPGFPVLIPLPLV